MTGIIPQQIITDLIFCNAFEKIREYCRKGYLDRMHMVERLPLSLKQFNNLAIRNS